MSNFTGFFWNFEQLPFIQTSCRRLSGCRFLKKIFVAGIFQKHHCFPEEWWGVGENDRWLSGHPGNSTFLHIQLFWLPCVFSADFGLAAQVIRKMWNSCKIQEYAQNTKNAPKGPENWGFLVLFMFFWSFRRASVDFWSADLKDLCRWNLPKTASFHGFESKNSQDRPLIVLLIPWHLWVATAIYTYIVQLNNTVPNR